MNFLLASSPPPSSFAFLCLWCRLGTREKRRRSCSIPIATTFTFIIDICIVILVLLKSFTCFKHCYKVIARLSLIQNTQTNTHTHTHQILRPSQQWWLWWSWCCWWWDYSFSRFFTKTKSYSLHFNWKQQWWQYKRARERKREQRRSYR